MVEQKKKTPKRFLCLNCGFVNDRCKDLKLPGATFAVCFKCRGKLVEREEWLEWIRDNREKHIDNVFGKL